jgi:hypothetical protein
VALCVGELSLVVWSPGTSEVFAGFNTDGHTVSITTWDGEISTLDIRSTQWAAFACDIAAPQPDTRGMA